MKSIWQSLLYGMLTIMSLDQLASTQLALQAESTVIVSPQINPDNSVTFRLFVLKARSVLLKLEGMPEPIEMEKDDEGIWSKTVGPLAPNYYGYSFLADGVNLTDLPNSLLKSSVIAPQSLVHVPGPLSLPWELSNVPHGEIHHYFYHSVIADDDRDYYVYTPPGYNSDDKEAYPVLYLLHGFSDDASAWTTVGRANVILDNLIARRKAKPMIVVMPLGYGLPEIVRQGWDGWNTTGLRKRNFDRFREALLTEIMPRVETEYRVNRDRAARAVAGLSMGGAEALLTGLNSLDKFAWIGAFSAAGIPEDFASYFPSLSAKANEPPRLLWISCGKKDLLIAANRKLCAWLKSREIKVTKIETPGAHTWMVWRCNLNEFLGRLFR